MATSIKRNFLYSSILTTAGYLFPLITFPYVSRVLGVTNIGVCNFVDSIINYFILFSMLGIQTTGIREIARLQDNKTGVSVVFCNLIALNAMFVLIFGAVLLVAIQIVPQFAEHKTLMYIGSVKLITTFAMIDWLYRGLEDFRYITIRSLVIRCLYVIAVFVFVRDEDDYPAYYGLTVASEGLNAMINCVHARKHLSLVVRNLRPFKYLRSALTLGIYSLLTSMYTSFNIAYLGFATNATEVGYYTTATKLHTIVLAFFTAFTSVMIPRMSKLLSEGKPQEFKEKVGRSFSLLVYFSFPLIVFCSVFSSEIVYVISGPGYEKAAIPLSIIIPLVFIIGFEQILVTQILVPMKKDRTVLINSMIGAAVGITANLLIVKSLGCVGSSIVWFLSEISVMIAAIAVVRTDFKLTTTLPVIFKNLLLAMPIAFACVAIKHLDVPRLWLMFMAFSSVVLYYSCMHLFVIKDVVVLSCLPQWGLLRKIKVNKTE